VTLQLDGSTTECRDRTRGLVRCDVLDHARERVGPEEVADSYPESAPHRACPCLWRNRASAGSTFYCCLDRVVSIVDSICEIPGDTIAAKRV
jgi:hypothetical protein